MARTLQPGPAGNNQPRVALMKYFLRYLCCYCISRLIFSAVRSSAKPCKAGQPCSRHTFGVFLFVGPLLVTLLFVAGYFWILSQGVAR